MTAKPQAGRLPPHNREAEECIIGTMLHIREARLTCANLLSGADFWVPLHGAIFEVLVGMEAEAAAPSRITLQDRLATRGMTVTDEQFAHFQTRATYRAPIEEAAIVARLATARRAILMLDDALGHAWHGSIDPVLGLLDAGRELLAPPFDDVTPPTGASVLAAEDHSVDWIIPQLIARTETVLIVAEPGSGKTTWLNQFATLCASGLHPWFRYQMPVVRCLVFDFQDSRGARGRSVQRMLGLAGNYYPANRGEDDTLFYELRSQGIDLTKRADQRWFEAKVVAAKPDIIVAGPLYNMVEGAPGRSKQSEETAQAAGSFLAELVVRRNCALLIEAHAPHGEELRVRGSKYWEDWAGWGFGFRLSINNGARMYTVERSMRGDRETGRQWPTRFVQGHPDHWPWEAPPEYVPKDPSRGTDEMMF